MSTTKQLHHNFNICIYIMKISIMDGFNKCQTHTIVKEHMNIPNKGSYKGLWTLITL